MAEEEAKHTQKYKSAEVGSGVGGLHSERQFCGDSFLWTSTCFGKSHRRVEDNKMLLQTSV